MSNDLIIRQAAIDALLGITPMQNTIPLDSAIFNIQNLPSAQQWILCSDRFPFLFPFAEYGESKDVLACLENGTMIVLYFDGGNWCYPTGEPYIGINRENGWHNRVVAWMPLPKPYKEENNE